MDHTIGHEHIGCDNLGTIDPHAIVCNSNGDVAPVDRGERAVGERRTLFHNTVNDMIREDVGKLLSREIGNSDANSVKILVGGSEYGDIIERANCVYQVSGSQGAGKGSKVGGHEGVSHRPEAR